MTIRCLVFGPLSDILPNQEIEVEESCTILQFRNHLYKQYPALKERRFTIARNHTIANDEDRLTHQDEVALLPPFSGG